MKKFISLLPLLTLVSCQWIATHPKEDAEVISAVEGIVKEIYEYETKTLSPAPPQPHVHHDLPPFKPRMN
jgi:hypothetical protein